MEREWGGILNCSSTAMEQFQEMMNPQMVMQVNGLTIIIVIFVGILVGIGLYMPHYRHKSFIRFFFLGATTLYLPILSYIISNGSTIASTLSKQRSNTFPRMSIDDSEIMVLDCNANLHLILIILWVALAQIIGINTNTMVAADDREHRNNGLPVVLVAKALWASYLAVDIVASDPFNPFVILLIVFGLVFIKIVLKCCAFWMARRSLAHGCNPRFIVGYMMQLHKRSHNVAPTLEQQTMTIDEQSQDESHQVILTVEQPAHKTYAELLPPPLVIMGEERQKVEKQPQGYCIKAIPNQDDNIMMNKSLVTIDKVWKLDNKLIDSMERFKDVCFSFALFKLLRCRFAGYTVVEVGFKQAHNFFWHELLQDSGADRVFSVIEDELSFLHDYYYTSLPTFYSKSWLPRLSIVTSLIVIIYCLWTACSIFPFIQIRNPSELGQISCIIWCGDRSRVDGLRAEDLDRIEIGSMFFETALMFLLLALVLLAEARDIGSYIFSNWTNVALICRYIAKHDTKHPPPIKHRWVSTVSGLRCRLMKNTMDKLNQCSVLVLHERYHPTVLLARLLILLRLGDRSKKVKLPPVVKAAIINTLIRNNGVKSSGDAFLPRTLQDGGNFIWDCSDKGVVHTILICHIATSLLELRRPKSGPTSDDEITSTHLSRYCAYLVSHMPELLPDDDRWCTSLYKAVKKNSSHLLSCGVSRYEVLVPLLSIPEAHEVLQKGASLAKKLETEHTGTEWNVLAEFWTEMILHVASSGKPDDHAEAIAGGAELITLLWALVMHAGPAPAPATATATVPAPAPAPAAPATATAPASPAPAAPATAHAPTPATVPAHEPSSVAPSAKIEPVIAD